MADNLKIVKVGAEAPSVPSVPSGPKTKAGTRRRAARIVPQVKRSMRTYPRGVLKKAGAIKVSGVRDPAKPPPMKRGATLRILTEKGAQQKRHKIQRTVRQMNDARVKHTLRASGFPIKDTTPPAIARQILEGGVEAGMIVVK